MSYTVKLHPKVDKFLKKCDMELQERVKKRLRLLKEESFRYLEHYEGKDYYKLRIGDYRALIEVDTSRNIVFVRVLDHRGRIYKRV
ncbi:type II toxin-antitoxin system RelE/ParE family toxin [Candidatus Woesearchaeota archaeon]|nr:type II toxin-antitoxin system RelE/ParE family toxin [Candidatus Woesearchaeota archaeon]